MASNSARAAHRKWLRANLSKAKKAAANVNATEKTHQSAMGDIRRYESALERMSAPPTKGKKKKGRKKGRK